MAAEKAPAFQFYPKEFLTDGNVAGMSLQERGAYITLICLCWQDGTLPTGRSRLANMVGLAPRMFARVWTNLAPCFREINGRLVHPRLEKERTKQAAYRRRQSDKGKAGAAIRWPGDSTGIAAAIAQAIPNHSSPLSDLRTPVVKKEPPTPFAHGRKQTRRNGVTGYVCAHDPKCGSFEACRDLILGKAEAS